MCAHFEESDVRRPPNLCQSCSVYWQAKQGLSFVMPSSAKLGRRSGRYNRRPRAQGLEIANTTSDEDEGGNEEVRQNTLLNDNGKGNDRGNPRVAKKPSVRGREHNNVENPISLQRVVKKPSVHSRDYNNVEKPTALQLEKMKKEAYMEGIRGKERAEKARQEERRQILIKKVNMDLQAFQDLLHQCTVYDQVRHEAFDFLECIHDTNVTGYAPLLRRFEEKKLENIAKTNKAKLCVQIEDMRRAMHIQEICTDCRFADEPQYRLTPQQVVENAFILSQISALELDVDLWKKMGDACSKLRHDLVALKLMHQ